MSGSYFKSKSIDEAVAGFTAGAVSTLLLHPLDLIKTRFQASTTRSTKLQLGSTSLAFKHIWNQHGWQGLYQGLTPNILGSTLSWGFYFFWYSQIKSFMQNDSQSNLAPYQHLLAAAQAGALTSLCTNPIWLMKTRMCLQSFDKPSYPSIFAGLRLIAQTEGIKGLYRGLLPSLFGVSHGAIQFMVYEEIKLYTNRHQLSEYMPSTLIYMFNGMVSKLIASITTYPYQVLKTRLQMDIELRPSIWHWIQRIWKHEGIRGFYKGLGPNILRVMPATCITFTVYESMSTFFKSSSTPALDS